MGDIATASSSAYLSSMSLDDRRRSGTVYTPEPLARFILDQAGLSAAATLDGAPVLDPSCGAGVFLCEVIRRAASRIGAGTLPLSGRQRRDLLRYTERNVFGIDIDPHARRLALDAMRAVLQDLAPGPLPAA